MPTLDELRAQAREHTRQLESVHFVEVKDLATRWGVDDEIVREIPREQLPYLEFGKTKRRRYDPRDVETYEREAKTAA